MKAQQWHQAIDVALNLVDEFNHSDTSDERARAFVAYLVGAVKFDDAELSAKLHAVLNPPTQVAAK